MIDTLSQLLDNQNMETQETALTELEEILENLHGEKDPELLKRIQDRSEAIR